MANLNQLSLLGQSKTTRVFLREDHELVHATSLKDWDKVTKSSWVRALEELFRELSPHLKTSLRLLVR